MGSRDCMFTTTKRALLALGMLVSIFGYGADGRNRTLGQTSRSTPATLSLRVMVVPIAQSDPAPPSRPAANQAIHYNLAGKPREQRYQVRTRAETLPGADGHAAAVLETLTIVPE